jgi:hypothetical protein
MTEKVGDILKEKRAALKYELFRRGKKFRVFVAVDVTLTFSFNLPLSISLLLGYLWVKADVAVIVGVGAFNHLKQFSLTECLLFKLWGS